MFATVISGGGNDRSRVAALACVVSYYRPAGNWAEIKLGIVGVACSVVT